MLVIDKFNFNKRQLIVLLRSVTDVSIGYLKLSMTISVLSIIGQKRNLGLVSVGINVRDLDDRMAMKKKDIINIILATCPDFARVY